ncbi:MAG: hypothetical protein FWD99_07535 [Oscillospiraceae bacterium]|nr:hypothetical protein [Oscillospiraceae bacterium]
MKWPFRKKKQEDAALKILLAVCEALPVEFDYIRRQIEDRCTFFVQTFGDNLVMNQGFLNVAKALSIQAKYADYTDSSEKNFIIDHIFISDFEKKKHKISIEIHHGLLLGFSIDIDQLEQADPETVCVKNLKLKYRIHQWETWFTAEEQKELEPLIRLGVCGICEVYLDNKLYYWLFDLADGDFIAMDTEKNLYQVTHDPYEIALMEENLLTFLNMITAHRQSENDSNTEESEQGDAYFVTLQLNARLQPFDRDDIYEAPLIDALEACGCGVVDGAGTGMLENGEIDFCDLHICLNDCNKETIDALLCIIEELGVPKGSFLKADGLNLPVGRLEGLALYLNGTELPSEIYETSDVNYVVEKINELLAQSGRMYSHWEGPQDTALYFYGASFSEMKKKMEPFLAEYPLCQTCRVEQIA